MATARIKFLQRKRIHQEHVLIRLEQTGDERRFVAQIDLREYGFPTDSLIVVDARTLFETVRYPLGTVGRGAACEPQRLPQFGSERITFSLYVIDPETSRKYGAAELIRAKTNSEQDGAPDSLLPVDLADDLNGCVWEIHYVDRDDLGATDAPVLVFDRESARGSAELFVSEPHVRALVLPAAFKEVLQRIVWVDRHQFDEDGEGWRDAWLRFAKHELGETPPMDLLSSNPDEVHQWVDRAVQRCATAHGFRDAFRRNESQ